MSRTGERAWAVRLTALALPAAVAVSVLYLPQALLRQLGDDRAIGIGHASLPATAVQLGYATGIVLCVPLADRFPARRLVPIQLVVLACALAATAALPTLGGIVVGFFVVGVSASAAQVIVPIASGAAPPDRRGMTTTVLLGAILIGIFGGRLLAGLLAGHVPWRGVVLVFAALVLASAIPALVAVADAGPSRGGADWARLVTGSLRLLVSSPSLTRSAAVHAGAFAAFNALWTVSSLHLVGGLRWRDDQISLFPVVGVIAGVVVIGLGRAVGRIGSERATTTTLVLLVGAGASIVVGGGSAVVFAAGMFVLSVATQISQSANQSRVLELHADSPARANTAFMTVVYLGGAVGTAAGARAYASGGLTHVAVLSVGVVIAAAGVWTVQRRSRPRAVPVADV